MTAAAEAPLDAARRGELDVALARLASAPRGSATDATSFAAAALVELLASGELRARTTESRGALVPDALLASLASGARLEGDPRELVRGLVDVALHAWLGGQPTRLALVRRASESTAAHPIVAAWDDLAHERAIDVTTLVAAAQRSRDVPGLLAEAEAIAALAELNEGRLDAARDRARLGSRVARTDGYLVTEYVAHLALARVRRFDARWYLASRILDSLARVTPPAWSGWIAWELVLVGGAARAAGLEGSSAWRSASNELAAMLDAASRGDRTRLDATSELAPWPFLAKERARVRALVDPSANAPPELRAWLAGEGNRAPHGMDGLVGSASLLGAGLERAGVVVWAEPGRAARRTWVAGLGLLGRDLPASYDLQHERVLAALVALLVTPSMSATEEELFRRVYGFAYAPDKHGGVLRTLLYRMRQELGARGEIVREGDALKLRLAAPIAIPDPTTATDLRELVLRFLAENGGRASARDVAEALGVPLRTVQDALGQLVGDESCRRERSGRTHEYALEDTTFFAPTITRLGAWRDALR